MALSAEEVSGSKPVNLLPTYLPTGGRKGLLLVRTSTADFISRYSQHTQNCYLLLVGYLD